MARLTHDDVRRLARDVAHRIPAQTPGWTDLNSHDPGIVVAQLLVFLTESLPGGGDGLSARARTLLTRATDRLQMVASHRPLSERLSRPHYFEGQLITPDVLNDEQEYQRARRRLHNRAVHGVGIVSGLAIDVQTDDDGGAAVIVSPGAALSSVGDELVLTEPITCREGLSGQTCVVCLRLVETPVRRLTTSTETAEYDRIEEGVLVSLESEPSPDALAIGRVEQRDGRWHVDTSFVPGRI